MGNFDSDMIKCVCNLICESMYDFLTISMWFSELNGFDIGKFVSVSI